MPFTNGVAELPPTTDFSVVRGTTVEASGKFTSGHAWVANGKVHATKAAAENRAVVHYHRADGDYSDWTMYHWTGSAEPSPGWTRSRDFKAVAARSFRRRWQETLQHERPVMHSAIPEKDMAYE